MSESVSSVHDELFHYTSAQGLTGIISSGNLWATHVKFLNDQEEYRIFFDKRFPAIIDRAFGLAYESVMDRPDVKKFIRTEGGFDSYKKRILAEIAPVVAEKTRSMNEPYVLSFCAPVSKKVRTHGLLSQWRAYGQDGGFAIVFDSVELEKLWRLEGTSVKGMPLFWGDVEYFDEPATDPGRYSETHEQTELVMESLAKWFVSRKSDDLEPIFDPIHRLACLTKHFGFEEEHEVRVVFSRPSRELFSLAPKEHKLKPLHHFVRDGAPVPYMAMFESLPMAVSGRLPIKRVIVGPHPDRLARKEAVETLLECNGYDAQVHVTEIPYRGR